MDSLSIPIKTAVLFHRGSKYDYFPDLSLGGKCLQYSDNMTYLGIKFGKRLTWADHIKSRVHKCTFLLRKTKNFVGLSFAWTLCIYEAIIHPKLSYSCIVRGPQPHPKKMQTCPFPSLGPSSAPCRSCRNHNSDCFSEILSAFVIPCYPSKRHS